MPRPVAPDRTSLALREEARSAPERMRELLPAIEPDRTLDDWGRSERIEGLMDATLVEFFYRYWFRVEVEGIENVPAEGGALLVSNHAGALPPDAPMIAKAIREEHPDPRPLHITVEHFFKGYPGFSMLIPKIGCVAAHPANVHRLLYDERQLVLVFPEGRKGTEKLYKDRYRLRRFGRGGFVEAAMRAEARLVPVCLIGAEEAMPVFAQLDFMKRLTGLLYFPVTPTFPWLGPLGMLGYLPAKFKIRFLEPIDTVELGGPEAAEDKALVQTVAQEIRARIQEGLREMVARRRSVWLG
jgi:1-acyl-sn-glycerol-3-phosphate acyltransferase